MSDEDWDNPYSQEWLALDKSARAVLARYGRHWDSERQDGDYYIVEDDYGSDLYQIDFQNLDMFQSVVIQSLQKLLADLPDWLIKVKVDVPNSGWPGMGVAIYRDRVFDELQRDYLPARFRNLIFGTIPPLLKTQEELAEKVRKLI